MSRATARHRAIVVAAIAALTVSATAVPALGWDDGGHKQDKGQYDQAKKGKGGHDRDYGKGRDYGKDRDHGSDHGGKDKSHGKGKPEKPAEQPPPQKPPVETPQPPAAQGPPVTPQGAPAQTPEQPVSTEALPGKTPESLAGGEEEESPVVAQGAPRNGQATVSAAPAAEREELAQTGIDPELIALFGVLLLGGGALLFRRALARG
jgi:LPXTG-motif cell wall-anchored protein